MNKTFLLGLLVLVLAATAVAAAPNCSITPVSPENESWTTNSTPTFTATLVCYGAMPVFCSLDMNGTASGYNNTDLSNANVSNASNFTITANSSKSDGHYPWLVNCSNGTAVNSSATRGLNIDATPPAITLIMPLNTTYNQGTSVTLEFNYTEVNPDECIYALDEDNATVIGYTNGTALTNVSGDHAVAICCNDLAGTFSPCDADENITWASFTINAIPTVPSGLSPTNGSATNDSTPSLSWTASNDTNGDDIHYYLHVSNTSDFTGSLSVTNTTFTSVDISLDDGVWWWRVLASDGIENSSWVIQNFTVDAPPVITLIMPLSTTYNQSTIVNLTFNYTETNPANCTYQLNGTNATVTANYTNVTNLTSVSGNRTIWVRCNDTNGSWSNNVSVNFKVNAKPSAPSSLIPTNGSNVSTLVVSWTASTDANGDTITYYVHVSNTSDFAVVNQSSSATNVSRTLSSLTNGVWWWRVLASDGTENSSWVNQTFTLETVAPVITQVGPLATTYDEDTLVVLNYSVSEANPANCTYKLDSADNVTTAYTSGTYNVVNLTSAGGAHSIKLWCNDTAGNWDSNFTDFTIADTPVVTLSSPAGGSSTTDTTPTLTYLVADLDDAAVTCTLYVGASAVASDAAAVADGVTANGLTSSVLALGTHSWYVNCTDGTNENKSSIWTIRVFQSGSGGSGGSSGSAPTPGSEYQEVYTPPEETNYTQMIKSDKNLQVALMEALKVDTLSDETVSSIAQISSEVAAKSAFTTNVEHTSTGGSRLTVTASYTGEKNLSGVVVVFTIPKSFASNASVVTVTTSPSIPSSKIVVIQSDPVYSFILDSFTAGGSFDAFFDIGTKVNRNTVRNDVDSPTMLVEEYEKVVQTAPPVKQVCGNGIKEGTEECDGAQGVTAGYKCGSDCMLKVLPEDVTTPPAPPVAPTTSPAEEQAATGISLAVIVIALLIVAVLAVGGFLLYTRYGTKKKGKNRL